MINEPLTEKCMRCNRGKNKGCNSMQEGQKGLHTGVRLQLRPEDEEHLSRQMKGNGLSGKIGSSDKTGVQ